MNRLTAIGVLWVALLLQTTRSVAQTTTPEMMKIWNMTLDTDKLTDKKMLTSIATVRVSDASPFFYQFTMKCDGLLQSINISTFEGSSNPRPIPWQATVTQTQSGGQVHTFSADPVIVREHATVTKPFRYRIDSDNINGDTLIQRYGNAGQTTSMFTGPINDLVTVKMATLIGHSQAEVQKLLDSGISSLRNPVKKLSTQTWQASFEVGIQERTFVLTWRDDATLASVSPDDAVMTARTVVIPQLPKTRLLIADVFPGETVEFSFSVLTTEARSALQKMCFPPQSQ
jgi:hypothetical protein